MSEGWDDEKSELDAEDDDVELDLGDDLDLDSWDDDADDDDDARTRTRTTSPRPRPPGSRRRPLGSISTATRVPAKGRCRPVSAETISRPPS